MHFVYIIVSVPRPDHHYVGLTENVRQRVAQHNEGIVRSTARFRPWRLRTAICFSDKNRAADFEEYLKTGSGSPFFESGFYDISQTSARARLSERPVIATKRSLDRGG